MKLFLSTLIIFCLFSAGCKKQKADDQSTLHKGVKGYVVAKGTGNPVPFAKVYLVEITGTGFNLSERIRDTYQTDSTGFYRFELDLNTFDYSYDLYAEENSEHYTSFERTHLDHKNNLNVNVPLIPFAWVKFRAVNTSPINYRDRCKIEAPFLGHPFIFYGSSIDTTVIFGVYGDMEYRVNIWIRKNDTNINHGVFLNVPKLDTFYYEYFY